MSARDQIHLTLHFLGESDPDEVSKRLSGLRSTPIVIDIEGVGHFRSPSGAVTLWAGVLPSRRLLNTRRAVAEVLAPLGFRPEERPYTPHITLARYEEGVDDNVVNGFLSARSDFRQTGVIVGELSLFSSRFMNGIPHYEKLRAFSFVWGDLDS